MAQLIKIESESQIKSSPSKFYDFFKNNMSQLINVFPEKFKSVQLLEGTDGCVGNVKLFKILMGKIVKQYYRFLIPSLLNLPLLYI